MATPVQAPRSPVPSPVGTGRGVLHWGTAQQFRCKDCHKSGVLNPKNRRSEAEIERILAAYRERPSMRGIARVFGISRNTLVKWLKKSPDTAGAEGNPPAR